MQVDDGRHGVLTDRSESDSAEYLGDDTRVMEWKMEERRKADKRVEMMR